MKALLVAVCHEPKWLPNVSANVARQALRLPATVVSNPNGAAAARNEAIALARRGGFEALILIDQDDHYGPGYVAQSLDALAAVDFCGKPAARVRMQSGELHTFRAAWPYLGGTLALRLGRALPFRHVVPGTDFDWCERMAAAGRTHRGTGPHEYVYQRRPGSVWRASDAVVRLTFGASDKAPAPTMLEALASLGAQ